MTFNLTTLLRNPPKTRSKKSLKIPKGQSESVYRRRTDNTMDKRKSTNGQTTIYKTYIYVYTYIRYLRFI